MAENWQFYPTLVDDQPASIFVDVGLDTPIAGFGELAWLRVHMHTPRPDGLASQEEYDALVALENDVVAAIIAVDAAIYVGRSTSASVRDFYFYTTGAGFAERVAAIMAVWPEYRYDYGCRCDEAWTTYRNFLYPTGEDLQRIGNRDVVRQLLAHGDDPEKPRLINHFAYFPTEAGRAGFAAWLAEHGYLVAPFGPSGNDQLAVLFERIDVPNQIDDATVALYQAAGENGGDYDGWECEVTE